jgi:hypothetical protein
MGYNQEMIKKYVYLMRGINVGGKNMVSMATLKSIFEGLGFTKVQTYITIRNAKTAKKLAALSKNER